MSDDADDTLPVTEVAHVRRLEAWGGMRWWPGIYDHFEVEPPSWLWLGPVGGDR